MGGKATKTSTSDTRINGMQVQKSTYGIPIPIGWGRGRVSANIIWYGGFTATAVVTTTTTASGGKGGGGGASTSTNTTYNYSASVLMMIGEGQIQNVTTVYRDQQVFDSPDQAGLGIVVGYQGQPPLGWLESRFPDEALGYSEIAYAYGADYALSTNATLQNHTFEVNWGIQVPGLADANPAVLTADFLENTRYGVPQWKTSMTGDYTTWSNYCLAANLLLSPMLDQQVTARDAMTEWLMATNSWANWSEGVLKVGCYGDETITGNGVTYTPDLEPIYDLTIDHFVPVATGGDPVNYLEADPSQIYNTIQIEFLDRTKGYDTNTVGANDLGDIDQYDSNPNTSPYTAHSICDPDVARQSVQLLLQRILYVRGTYQFTLTQDFILLENGDIVTLTDPGLGLNRHLVRITQIEEDQATGQLAMTAEPMPGVASAALYDTNSSVTSYRANYAVAPGSVEANLLVQSSAFDDAEWTKFNVIISPNVAISPDGLTTADQVNPTGVTAGHAMAQGCVPLPGAAHVFAIYLKAAGVNNVQLRMSDAPGGVETNGVDMFVDVSTGTIHQGPTVFGTATVVGSGVVAIGNGWYRLWVAAIIPDATTLIRGKLDYLDASWNGTWMGNGVNGILHWGAQLRPGSSLPQYVASGISNAGPVIFTPPSALTAAGAETWAAVASIDPNWGGCYIWVSADNSNYKCAGQTSGRARIGFTTNSLPTSVDPFTGLLGVDLGVSLGSLETATQADADTGSTLFQLGDELLSYETATLFATNAYNLSYIRRGLMGTLNEPHATGTPFVRLDASIFKFPFNSTQAGKTIYVKFQSYNIYGEQAVDLSQCIAHTFEPTTLTTPIPPTADWNATGTTFTQGASSVPGIVVNGRCSNPDATLMHLYFRVTGLASFTAEGTYPPTASRIEISGLTSSTNYDLAISYVVAGVEGPLLSLGTVMSGVQSGPGAPPSSGTVLISSDGTYVYEGNISNSATWTVPVGVTEIKVERWAAGGTGGGAYDANPSDPKNPEYTLGGGGGGGEYIADTFTVTAGQVFTYSVGIGSIQAWVQTYTDFTSLSRAHGGGGGSVGAGAGGTGGTGQVVLPGRAGGLTGSYVSGGGAGNGGGDVGSGDGSAPGGGGAGGPGGGVNGICNGANGRVRITVA